MGIGKRIEAAMTRAGKRPADIARHLQITESAVSQWFSKDAGPKTARLAELATFLNTTVDDLMRPDEQLDLPTIKFSPRLSARPPAPAQMPVQTSAAADVPVWASVAAGNGQGEMILTDTPIDYIRRSEHIANAVDPFAFYIVGDSMEERFYQGDQVVVNRSLPVRPGDDCVFIAQSPDGELRGLVKRLIRSTADAWKVRQFNPRKDFDLLKRPWSRAYRIVETRHRS